MKHFANTKRQSMIKGAAALLAWALTSGAVEPLTVELETIDAERFAAVYAASDGKPSAEALQAGYLDDAGQGVAIFTAGRIESAANLAAAVRSDSARYSYAIRTCLPLARDMTAEMRSVYLAYRGLVPELPLPRVHLVFGAGNSGGTARDGAQVLGLEVLCGPGTSEQQFRATMRNIFAHEVVHTWQTGPSHATMEDALLTSALREGVPEFLALLVTGTVPGPERNRWALARESWLWGEFERDRTGSAAVTDAEKERRLKRWFGNYGAAPEGWPFEAGYWVGMRIAQGYFAKANDKQLAIRELIAMDNPQAILAASGYNGT